MSTMIRKQIYIDRTQNRQLKKLARAHGVSEAEIIRRAIDKQISGGTTRSRPDAEAWDKAYKFMMSVRNRGPLKDEPRSWKREDLYEDRLSRHGRHSD